MDAQVQTPAQAPGGVSTSTTYYVVPNQPQVAYVPAYGGYYPYAPATYVDTSNNNAVSQATYIIATLIIVFFLAPFAILIFVAFCASLTSPSHTGCGCGG